LARGSGCLSRFAAIKPPRRAAHAGYLRVKKQEADGLFTIVRSDKSVRAG